MDDGTEELLIRRWHLWRINPIAQQKDCRPHEIRNGGTRRRVNYYLPAGGLDLGRGTCGGSTEACGVRWSDDRIELCSGIFGPAQAQVPGRLTKPFGQRLC
jgi:hypothetical protein